MNGSWRSSAKCHLLVLRDRLEKSSFNFEDKKAPLSPYTSSLAGSTPGNPILISPLLVLRRPNGSAGLT
jgi:hypothetical protein